MPENPNGNPAPNGEEAPLSQGEIDDYIKRFEQLERDFKELTFRNDALLTAWLRGLAGSHLELLLESQDETLRCISDPDPNLRRAAVHLAVEHWGLTAAIAGSCERMAITDPDYGVRETAIGALGSCYAATKDVKVGRLLTSLIKDEKIPEQHRVRAYLSLIRVHGYGDYSGKAAFAIKSIDDFDTCLIDQYGVAENGDTLRS